MAKSTRRTGRGATHTATLAPDVFLTDLSLGDPSEYVHLGTLGPAVQSDRRYWHPEKNTRRAATMYRYAARLVDTAITVNRRKRRFHAQIASLTDPTYYIRREVRSRIGFSIPRRVEVCLRRHIRKRVLFAHKKTGRGHRRKKPIRNIWSAISCKRH